MDQKTRKLILMHKALHVRDDGQSVQSKEGGRGFSNIEDWVHQYEDLKITLKRAKKD